MYDVTFASSSVKAILALSRAESLIRDASLVTNEYFHPIFNSYKAEEKKKKRRKRAT